MLLEFQLKDHILAAFIENGLRDDQTAADRALAITIPFFKDGEPWYVQDMELAGGSAGLVPVVTQTGHPNNTITTLNIHGGEVYLKSEEGTGSTFGLLLPL